MMFPSSMSTRLMFSRALASLALVCALALLSFIPAASAAPSGQVEPVVSKPGAAATLQQCLTTGAQTERSATFAGEMTATPATARMEMRIDVLERMPTDFAYHMVTAPGLGVWSSSAPGVKTYRNLNKVVNLAAPAFYRAAVRFRWLNARGRILKTTELRTRRCEQPAPVAPATETETPSTGSTTPATNG